MGDEGNEEMLIQEYKLATWINSEDLMPSVVIMDKIIVLLLYTWTFLKDEIKMFSLKQEIVIMWCDGCVRLHYDGNYIAIYKYIQLICCTP